MLGSPTVLHPAFDSYTGLVGYSWKQRRDTLPDDIDPRLL